MPCDSRLLAICFGLPHQRKHSCGSSFNAVWSIENAVCSFFYSLEKVLLLDSNTCLTRLMPIRSLDRSALIYVAFWLFSKWCFWHHLAFNQNGVSDGSIWVLDLMKPCNCHLALVLKCSLLHVLFICLWSRHSAYILLASMVPCGAPALSRRSRVILYWQLRINSTIYEVEGKGNYLVWL